MHSKLFLLKPKTMQIYWENLSEHTAFESKMALQHNLPGVESTILVSFIMEVMAHEEQKEEAINEEYATSGQKKIAEALLSIKRRGVKVISKVSFENDSIVLTKAHAYHDWLNHISALVEYKIKEIYSPDEVIFSGKAKIHPSSEASLGG